MQIIFRAVEGACAQFSKTRARATMTTFSNQYTKLRNFAQAQLDELTGANAEEEEGEAEYYDEEDDAPEETNDDA